MDFLVIIIIIIVSITIKNNQLCTAGRELKHSISPKIPNPHNRPAEESKKKTFEDKRRENIKANKKALTCS